MSGVCQPAVGGWPGISLGLDWSVEGSVKGHRKSVWNVRML